MKIQAIDQSLFRPGREKQPFKSEFFVKKRKTKSQSQDKLINDSFSFSEEGQQLLNNTKESK